MNLSNKERATLVARVKIMKDLICKKRLLETLWDIPVELLKPKNKHDIDMNTYQIIINIIFGITDIIEKMPPVYSVEKAQEDYDRIKFRERLFDVDNMDLDIPQHFTKEQGEWIKKYCIQRNIEFYNKAIDDFINFVNTSPEIEEDDYIRGMSLEEMADCCKIKNLILDKLNLII